MRKTTFLSLCAVLFIAAVLIVNFGCGGDSSGVIPEGNISQTDQTENLVMKDVEGIIFNVSNSQKSTEEEEENFSVLPIPMEGDEGFFAQINEYLAENPSSKASDSEMQELLTAFGEEAGNYQPLPNWNSSAGLYSAYADTDISPAVPVGADGAFSASVLTDADEDLVPLEIIVPDGECFEVETISSELLNSSESTGINLKACPSKIITKPNRCIIFEVFSKPGANLYEAGLEFNLANPEIGAVCGPIFLRCFGKRKVNAAYGILYVKKDVATPFDTAINVSTSGGQSLNIPVQIVKNTAVVSGKVYTSSPLVKGYVASIGPKSFCRLNGDGSYSLPKTYMGTGRKIVATWWTQEGNKKVKHREVKYVDVMGDCVVDFGVVPVPTMRPIGDPYYDLQVAKVLYGMGKFEEEFSQEEAVQKSITWLNGGISLNVPAPEGIAEAYADENSSTIYHIKFEDGMIVGIETEPFPSSLEEPETSETS
ncbi:hypothetical protein KKB18_06915, partial [bacterium]|nr:hypothetical protein [bacterium]